MQVNRFRALMAAMASSLSGTKVSRPALNYGPLSSDPNNVMVSKGVRSRRRRAAKAHARLLEQKSQS